MASRISGGEENPTLPTQLLSHYTTAFINDAYANHLTEISAGHDDILHRLEGCLTKKLTGVPLSTPDMSDYLSFFGGSEVAVVRESRPYASLFFPGQTLYIPIQPKMLELPRLPEPTHRYSDEAINLVSTYPSLHNMVYWHARTQYGGITVFSEDDAGMEGSGTLEAFEFAEYMLRTYLPLHEFMACQRARLDNRVAMEMKGELDTVVATLGPSLPQHPSALQQFRQYDDPVYERDELQISGDDTDEEDEGGVGWATALQRRAYSEEEEKEEGEEEEKEEGEEEKEGEAGWATALQQHARMRHAW